ncbi:MAG TPA: glycosyl hydrolase family 18 protein [Chloroflexota bacterium]|jgi:spore germination protein YaaH
MVILGLLLAVLLPVSAAALPAKEPVVQASAGRRVLGYYAPGDPTSWASLQENASAIDAIAGHWISIDACGNLASRDDQTLKQFAQANNIQVFPSLLTLSGWLNHQLLSDETVTANSIQQIVHYVTAEGYDGFDLDFEGVEAADRAAYTAYVAALGAALHEHGKALALALAAKTRDATTGWAGAYDYAALGHYADLITLMAYDYHGAWGGPGPVAPADWVDQVLAFATSQLPAEKVLLGIAFYGYDWNTTSGGTRSLSYSQAARLADRYQVPIALDAATQSATFRFEAPASDPGPGTLPVPPLEHLVTTRAAPPCPAVSPTAAPRPTAQPPPASSATQEHEVWLEESASAAARLALADRYGVGGVATWRLGLEDPRVWPLFRQWRGNGSEESVGYQAAGRVHLIR